MSDALTWQVESRDGLALVTVSGTVDTRSGSALYHALTQCLSREPRAVLVDLTRAGTTNSQAAQAFATVLNDAQPWPGTPVLLCTPDPATAAMITAVADAPPPLYATMTEALSTLEEYDDVVSEVALPVSGAARRARDVVTEACVRWNMPQLIAPATLVASELVTNAVLHAHTLTTLQVALRPRHLYLAVTDGSPDPPLPRTETRPDMIGGRGLHLVDIAADRWGYRQHHDGKTVWACFALRTAHHRITAPEQ
nr:ATP-binding protein [uncultured Actinoplanes sp.]